MNLVHARKSVEVILITFFMMATTIFSSCTKDSVVEPSTNTSLTYSIVDTYQDLTYDNLTQITPPADE